MKSIINPSLPGPWIIDPENMEIRPSTFRVGEDIYDRAKEMTEIDPEDITKTKTRNSDTMQEDQQDVMGSDLDVPGSEMDDDQEITGSEDEENNYYSLP